MTMNRNPLVRTVEYTHFHLFCGLGLGALGFNAGSARVGNVTARLRCIGGVDVSPAAIRDFTRLVGVPGTVLDLFTLDQYVSFHRGKAPPDGWREATPADILAAAGGEFPDIVFLSAPCKGFSGLLNTQSAASRRYQALNRLTVRGIELMLQAFADCPPRLILFENVPRIATRGRDLMDVIVRLLERHGYAVAETTHDCGELGGLAQRRQRFLLVARHRQRVPPFLYEPPRKRVRSVGEVLGDLPLPEDPRGGAMHRLPRLQWRTWVRLALIEAGSDWRSLNRLDVEDGFVKGLGLVPGLREFGGGPLGVTPWDEPAGTVAGQSRPTNGRFSVADPRPPRDLGRYEPYGVVPWTETGRTVTGQAAPGAGPYSVADPRLECDANDPRRRRFNNVFRVVAWDQTSQAVTGGTGPSAGGQAIADPRVGSKREGGDYASARHYGVLHFDETSPAVTGSACHDNGAHSVADPRLPEALDRPDPVPLIISLDDTWHRPFTTLELAALQSFPVLPEDGDALVLDGTSDSAWRERIGNAVPRDAAEACASTFAHTLLMADLGHTFQLSALPIWVHPLAISLSMARPERVWSV